MRLLFAIKSLNVPGGGAERVLVQVANGLAARGHDIAVLSFDPPGRSFYPLDHRVSRIDLAVGPPGQPTPRLALLRALPRMRRAAREFAPHLCIGFMHSMYVPLAIALLGAGLPMLASEHAVPRHFVGRAFERWLVGLARGLAVATTVPSGAARDAQPSRWQARLEILPNPLPEGSFDRVHDLVPAHPPVLLCVGRFMAEKGHEILVRAFDRVASRHPEWRLRLVGEGELRPRIEACVAELGSRARIQMPGATRDIASEYAAASVIVVPSFHESFGMVTLEAQACGRPVLGFDDCAGSRDLIEHSVNGWLVDGAEDRVQSLADGLDVLMSDPALRARLGAAGPAAASRFGSSEILDQWQASLRRHAGVSAQGDEAPGGR